MKTDFSINVQVNVGISPEIVALVNAILGHKPAVEQKAEGVLEENSKVDIKPKGTSPTQPTKGPANEADAKDAQAAAREETEAEKAASQDENQTKTPAEAGLWSLTAEDVRAAMHVTRQRIEGEDYKENTDGELYKKYHKPLTAWFKNIAALLGADKPSALPSDKIASFIEQCSGLQVMEDGTIGSNCPF